MTRVELDPVGVVESPLTDRDEAPKQGDEGAPDCWIVIEPAVSQALDGIDRGDRIIAITWLDRGDRSVLRVHPRGNAANAVRGVFATRSPDRPNPIGLHEIEVVQVEGNRLLVRDLEAIDGTPVLDLKPVLEPRGARDPGPC